MRQSNSRAKVLICPLDWGLGHAARCVPIIKLLIDNNAEVLIGADKGPYALLKKEFPQLQFISFPSFLIKYPANGSMVLKMIMSVPLIIIGIFKEHKMLNRLITENNIDIVISDNRYGLWNKKVYSVFMTHQLMIKCPWFLKFMEPALNLIVRYFIRKYDECWIPDFKDVNNLSGDLSHNYKLPANAYFINPLSRFNKRIPDIPFITKHHALSAKHSILIILSGPEPQRTILEEKILNQLNLATGNRKLNSNFAIIRGLATLNELNLPVTDEVLSRANQNIAIYSHLGSSEMFQVIQSAELIVCRSGYSGIMDLVALDKKAIFIPTPGQTEQEYLAEFHFKHGNFYYEKQNTFNLLQAIDNAENFYNNSNRSQKKYNAFDNRLLFERINEIFYKYLHYSNN